MDGVTLGHVCCAVHNCQIPLATSRDRYCPLHRGLSNICAIKGCNKRVLEGKRTCANRDHQEVERIYVLRGESHVQLQEKLKRQCVSHPNDGIAEDVDIGELIDDGEEEDLRLMNKIPMWFMASMKVFPIYEGLLHCQRVWSPGRREFRHSLEGEERTTSRF